MSQFHAVFGPGGLSGAVQIGFAKGLVRQGLQSHISGITAQSIGSLVGAAIASNRVDIAYDLFEDMVTGRNSPNGRPLFPAHDASLEGLRTGRAVNSEFLEQAVRTVFEPQSLSAVPYRVRVQVEHARDHTSHYFDLQQTGVDALLASTKIIGSVRIGEQQYCDGAYGGTVLQPNHIRPEQQQVFVWAYDPLVNASATKRLSQMIAGVLRGHDVRSGVQAVRRYNSASEQEKQVWSSLVASSDPTKLVLCVPGLAPNSAIRDCAEIYRLQKLGESLADRVEPYLNSLTRLEPRAA